jgi:hypothetical protein
MSEAQHKEFCANNNPGVEPCRDSGMRFGDLEVYQIAMCIKADDYKQQNRYNKHFMSEHIRCIEYVFVYDCISLDHTQRHTHTHTRI